MVLLRNFTKNDQNLECDFYPEAIETKENKCHIVIDIETEEIVSVDIPETSKCYSMDIGGARTVLAKYINEEKFPEMDYYIEG